MARTKRLSKVRKGSIRGKGKRVRRVQSKRMGKKRTKRSSKSSSRSNKRMRRSFIKKSRGRPRRSLRRMRGGSSTLSSSDITRVENDYRYKIIEGEIDRILELPEKDRIGSTKSRMKMCIKQDKASKSDKGFDWAVVDRITLPLLRYKRLSILLAELETGVTIDREQYMEDYERHWIQFLEEEAERKK